MSPIKTKAISAGLTASLIASLFASPAFAQSSPQRNDYQQERYGQNAEYVLVYEDCYFRGNSRALTVGEYNDVRDLKIRNDSISSLKVPAGLQAILFEDERLRGRSTVVTSDVSCLDKGWNDRASSLQVIDNQRNNNSAGRYNRNDNDRYGNARNTNRNDNDRYGNSRNSNRNDTYRNNAGRDYTRGIEYVSFLSTALEKANGNQWQIRGNNGSVDTFRETGRDNQSIYLQNNRINQQVEVDLFANQIRFIAPNGNKIEYAITGTDNRGKSRNSTVNNTPYAPSGFIKGSCFDYKAYTLGGGAGIRFHEHEGFYQYDRKPHTGRICHQGALTMEVSKKELSTDVIVEINGEKYRFANGEKEDMLLNTWYRKLIKLKVVR